MAVNEKVLKKEEIIDCVRQAGVVGAGGAGFPTHIKLAAQAEFVIANGAECEPLLESDRHLMLREPGKIIAGLKAAVAAVGAAKGIIALKKKHKDIVTILEALLAKEKKLELFLLDNFYPAGDEHVLVYEVTGRVVPMGGIPLNTGVVVDNVYTLAMIKDAIDGRSFTHRYITVTGSVKHPAVAEVPIGMSISEVIDKVGGGASVERYKVIVGGPMMGKIEEDTKNPVTKTTSGIIVMPENSKLIRMKSAPIEASVKRGKSVCCQCSLCTDMCPRFLLGHNLKPHVTMRVISNSEQINEDNVYQASLCCECGLCGYYTCTMGLAPNLVNGYLKGIMAKNGVKPDFSTAIKRDADPFREGRKIPASRLIGRLGLMDYDMHLPFIEINYKPKVINIPLRQHIGAASQPVVQPGDGIKAGGLLAKLTEKGLGANIHCPLEGIVKEVNKDHIIISVDLKSEVRLNESIGCN